LNRPQIAFLATDPSPHSHGENPMTAANFPRALTLVFRSEGGYVDHPSDPGGATNRGITLATLSACRGRACTKDDIRRLTAAEAGEIYRTRYWDKAGCNDLPAGIDHAVFDAAVHSGPGRAVRMLQTALHVAPDGIVGPVTLAAARRADPLAVVASIGEQRLAMMRRLPGWTVFGRGWTRRLAAVRADAAMMARPPTLFARLFGRSAGIARLFSRKENR
jgi:lysozyme family protein